MDSPLRLSGFDRSEMIPPVPAPRYKRKSITNEDSKYTSNKQNTRVREQTTEILPPPRRRNKHSTNQNSNVIVPDCNPKLKYSERKIEAIPAASNIVEVISTEKQSVSSEENIFENGESHKEIDQCKSLDLGAKIPSKISEITPAFIETVDSSILKNYVEDRVLDIHLENSEEYRVHCADEQILAPKFLNVSHSEENRVNSSLTENSATIVGVFYKPEYSLLKQLNDVKHVNSNVNHMLDSAVWLHNLASDGNKKNVVPPNDCMQLNNNINKKDSEENDSGVYFSDTRSPPYRNNDEEIVIKSSNEKSTGSNDPLFCKPFTCNDRDTFDNKSVEDLGPQIYNEMLDSFEAQTVSAFREEVTGRLSLCDGKLSKHEDVENWLDNRGYLSKKKVIDSSFSEYLRNMLEIDGSEGTLSPYPLSTVDESSDISEIGPNDEEKVVNRSNVIEACTVPCSLSETHENRILGCSNNYLSPFVEIKTVNKMNVNNECTEVTPSNIKNINLFDSSNNNEDDFGIIYSVGELRFSNKSDTNQYNVFYEETNHPVAVSPSIQHGAVNKLVTYFETIYMQENSDHEEESVLEDEIDEVYEAAQDGETLTSNFQGCSDTFSPVTEVENDKTPYVDFSDENRTEKYPNEKDNMFIQGLGNVEYNSIAKSLEDVQNFEEVILKSTVYQNDMVQKQEKISFAEHEILPLRRDLTEDGKFENDSFVVFTEEMGVETGVELLTMGKIEDLKDGLDVAPVGTCTEDYTSNNTEYSDLNNFENESNLTAQISHVSEVEAETEELSPPLEFADNELPDLTSDFIEINNYKNEVPKINSIAKDQQENDNVFCSFFKPTRIPIVVLTEADVLSAPIGSIELHPPEKPTENEQTEGTTDGQLFQITPITIMADTPSPSDVNVWCEESLLESAVTVVLEKNWGSIGLKIKGDKYGVIVSEVLAGGAADESGLVFKGLVFSKEMVQETRILFQSGSQPHVEKFQTYPVHSGQVVINAIFYV